MLLKWSLLGTSVWMTSKCYNIEYLGGRGGLKFVTFLLWQICCSIFQITLPESFVWVINISLIFLLYILNFSPLKVALNYNFLKKTEIQDGGSKMADPRWRTTISNFRLLLLPIAFSRCTSVSLLLVHKKGWLKRWLYQYYWYLTYLSWQIIRNIEKLEYDVTVTSSLGVTSQNWVWGFFVWRWSLCINFMTLAFCFQRYRGGVRGAPPPPPPPVTDWPKKPSLNRAKVDPTEK